MSSRNVVTSFFVKGEVLGEWINGIIFVGVYCSWPNGSGRGDLVFIVGVSLDLGQSGRVVECSAGAFSSKSSSPK